MTHMNTYRLYYDAIIARMSLDPEVQESISNLIIEDFDRALESVCFNGTVPRTTDGTYLPYTWDLLSQFNNDNFKFIVDNYSTSDVLKLIIFKGHNYKYNDGSINIDHKFILDSQYNPVRVGDTVVAGYLSTFKVEAITKSFKVRVTNRPSSTRPYKYYYPSEVLRLISNTIWED